MDEKDIKLLTVNTCRLIRKKTENFDNNADIYYINTITYYSLLLASAQTYSFVKAEVI
jgi:hypothetical protein